jgi:hypothetical protein
MQMSVCRWIRPVARLLSRLGVYEPGGEFGEIVFDAGGKLGFYICV